MTNGPGLRFSAALASKADKGGDAAMSRFRGRAWLAQAAVRATRRSDGDVAVLLAPMPAYADSSVPVGNDGGFSLSGAGFRRGIGMSQFGEYGATVALRTWPEIHALYLGASGFVGSLLRSLGAWCDPDY